MDKARFVQLQIQMQDAFARLSDAIYEMAKAETYEWAMTKVLSAVYSQDPEDRPKPPAGGTASAGETVPAGEASARKTELAGETAPAGRVEASKETLYPEYNEAKKQWLGRIRKNSAKPDPLPAQGSTHPRMPRAVVYCPVPGCKGVAAPIFGMVCAQHKDVPRERIARYFEERRRLKAILEQVGEI
jgi:hypothetical protein